MFDLPPPAFERVVIDATVEIGYGVAVADVDGDGRRDVLLVDAHEVRWYRAPDWQRYVLCGRLSDADHVALAARDVDGDGKCEVAVAAGWNPGDTVGSGALFWLEPPADRTQPWTPRALPCAPTLHRIAFVHQPGLAVGDWSLVGLPLHGRASKNGEGGDGARLLTLPWREVPELRDGAEGHEPHSGVAHDHDAGDDHHPGDGHGHDHGARTTSRSRFEGRLEFREAHGFDVVDRDGDGVEELLLAEREGIWPLVRLDGGEFAGDWGGLPLPRADASGALLPPHAASEVRLGQRRDGRRFLATIEPFHGNALVATFEPARAGEPWVRTVVDESLAEGHALRCGDLLMRGESQLVAGWRRPDARGKTGIRLYAPRADRGGAGPIAFEAMTLDESIACEDLQLADLDADGRLDVVASGRATHDLVLLLNRTPWPTAAPREEEPAQRFARRAPFDVAALGAIDRALADARARGELPPTVVAIGRSDGLHYARARGADASAPLPLDALFDLASLTKPLVTAALVADLADGADSAAGAAAAGFSLDDPLAKWLPEVAARDVTVRQCLLHTAGFVPDNELADYQAGREAAWERLFAQQPVTPPGVQFTYSDVGYELLGKLVERLHGAPLDVVARRVLFEPLALRDTGYRPDAAQAARCVPTEVRDGALLRGVVHDPRAALLGGVAGHAGLFSSALDLARFARMVLHEGELDGVRVLSRAAVARLTTPQHAASGALRTPGFDARSRFSSNRGATMGGRAFGHGGFTGTALWIDPDLDLFVLFLSSRLAPEPDVVVNPLIGRIASIAAAAVGRPSGGGATDRATDGVNSGDDEAASEAAREAAREAAEPFPVETGADLVAATGGGRLLGRKIGLIANQSARTRDGTPLVELLQSLRPALELRVLFSPEHGFAGRADEEVADSVDAATGLPIVSLYGERQAPTTAQLEGLDTLVFDLQDAGARCYTYASTLALCMEAAAAAGVRFVVLDRPNPIGGVAIGGPLPDSGRASFTALHPLPLRHGLTMGELARLYVAERGLALELEVVELAGWRRAQLFDATLLPWIDPSPNLRTLDAALLYPGLVVLERTSLSLGRGTDLPFEQFGAPWLDARALVAALTERRLPGVTFMEVAFTPSGSKHAGVACRGVRVHVVDRAALDPFRVVLEIAAELHARHADVWSLDDVDALLCSKATIAALRAGRAPELIAEEWQAEAEAFRVRRAPFLLYE
ncbi:MAG: DUF1343 domain-containing protein [Planctomycetes bacterium]|nr:DUF1343 domain-containing protein [Planctomycetota bacterium]